MHLHFVGKPKGKRPSSKWMEILKLNYKK